MTLADTGEEAMTAFRVKSIQRYVPKGEPFLLTYGDGLANLDVNASIEAHKRSGKVCTISAVHPAGRFGAGELGGSLGPRPVEFKHAPASLSLDFLFWPLCYGPKGASRCLTRFP